MTPNDILAAYRLGTIDSVVPVGTGLINTTYRVVTNDGDFVLQKLHDVIPDAAALDMQVVTAHLASKGMLVPALVLTVDNAPFARDADGARWRLYPWIKGSVIDSVHDPAVAFEAGRIVGEMHRHLAELDYVPQGSIPHFHDTAFIADELQAVAEELPSALAPMASDILATLPELIAEVAGDAPQIVHGDLKISNLIFSAEGRAVGVIDFDTILRHSRLIDLGDALRSWCNATGEDDAGAVMSSELFNSATAGYTTGFGQVTDTDSRVRYLRAAKLIALELASRFLIDVVRDTYFGFDAKRYPDRRSHNMARAIGQYHYALSIPLN